MIKTECPPPLSILVYIYVRLGREGEWGREEREGGSGDFKLIDPRTRQLTTCKYFCPSTSLIATPSLSVTQFYYSQFYNSLQFYCTWTLKTVGNYKMIHISNKWYVFSYFNFISDKPFYFIKKIHDWRPNLGYLKKCDPPYLRPSRIIDCFFMVAQKWYCIDH